jgi:hypothetical protein
MSSATQNNYSDEPTDNTLDETDKKIESGEIKAKRGFHFPEVLDTLKYVFEDEGVNKTRPRPRGKKMPIFNMNEMQLIDNYLLFKPKGSFIFIPGWEYYKVRKEYLNEEGKMDGKKMKFSPKELILELLNMLYNDDYKKRKPAPRFTMQEFRFIRDLILNKGKGLAFFYLADFMVNNGNTRMFFDRRYRKTMLWYQHLLENRCNATRAAILAGYSPKYAKQAGYRNMKRLQRYFHGGK